MIKNIYAAVIALVAATAQADPNTFQFSYAYMPGFAITGSFSGTQSGDLVTDLSNISVYIDGVGFKGNGHLYQAHYVSRYTLVSGGAVASFSGLHNNFFFIDTSYPGPGFFQNFFSFAPTQDFAQVETYEYVSGGWWSQTFVDHGKWSLVTAVPEPETYAMLLAGLGMMAAVARRRKARGA